MCPKPVILFASNIFSSSSHRLVISPLLMILVVTLSIIPISGFSQMTVRESPNCNCVIFRLDDIQDDWIDSGQVTLMDLFLSKDLPLSLGLIMNDIGNDPQIVDKVREGSQTGLFELALHGWNHVDYTKLGERVQESTLRLANQKMERIFGRSSDIFITPYGTFNDATLQAMTRNGLKILSSVFFAEDNFDHGKSVFVANGKSNTNNNNNNAKLGIYHLPATVAYKEEEGNRFIKNSIESILATVDQNIAQYGYSVIMLHPQDFMILDQKGDVTETLDDNEIKDLTLLIDSLLTKNIEITSFSKVVESMPESQAIPEDNGDTVPSVPELSNPIVFNPS